MSWWCWLEEEQELSSLLLILAASPVVISILIITSILGSREKALAFPVNQQVFQKRLYIPQTRSELGTEEIRIEKQKSG